MMLSKVPWLMFCSHAYGAFEELICLKKITKLEWTVLVQFDSSYNFENEDSKSNLVVTHFLDLYRILFFSDCIFMC